MIEKDEGLLASVQQEWGRWSQGPWNGWQEDGVFV